jgi:hypothetical protein
MRRMLTRVTHIHVVVTMYTLGAVLEVVALGIAAVRGDGVDSINAVYAALIGGGMVWSYQKLTGKIKAE